MLAAALRTTMRSGARHFAAAASEGVKYGFIGLGNMGGPMAHNLLTKSGRPVVVFDVAQSSVDTAVSRGATAAKSPSDIAKQCDVIITMLPTPQHVKDVVAGAILPVARPNALLIDCSTIDPLVTQQLAKDASAAKARLVDAPVSGGVGGAAAGTLTFMVGGNDSEFAEAKGVLQHMGKNIVHCGPVGTGEIAKLCNNLLLGISMIGVAEAMNLGVQLGIDAKVLAGIINTSSGRCWSSDTYNPCPGVMEGVPASRGYTGGFGSPLMLKDLGLANHAARAQKVPLPLGQLAEQVYRTMCEQGYSSKDFSAVFEYLQTKAKAQ